MTFQDKKIIRPDAGDYEETEGIDLAGNAEKLGLLDRLYRHMGLNYLSDLYVLDESSPCRLDLIRVLEDIRPEEYPLCVWEDAYQYLTGRTETFVSAQEGKQRLLQWLK